MHSSEPPAEIVERLLRRRGKRQILARDPMSARWQAEPIKLLKDSA
jgi:hypothetical protein